MALIWDPETTFTAVRRGEGNVAEGYGALLAQSPVARMDNGMWGLFSYAEVDKAAMDLGTFSSVSVPEGTPRILPLMADPPEHTAYRRFITKAFQPPLIAAAEAQARPLAGRMIDKLVAGGKADFAQTFAYPFSTRVLCQFLNVEFDWRIYNDWSSEMERATGAGTAKPGAALPDNIFNGIVPYIQALVTARRAAPGADPVSEIIAGEVDSRPLDDECVVGLVIALILAGRSTTASGIGNLVLQLARDADLQHFLREDPGRIKDAVEESLRLDGPQQEQPRKATRDVQIAGETIHAGDSVFLNFGSANVDPRRWSEPGRFYIDRKQRQHFGFGRGAHMCFGAPLARMQMRVAAETLLAATSSFTLNSEVMRRSWPRLSVETLPLALTPRD